MRRGAERLGNVDSDDEVPERLLAGKESHQICLDSSGMRVCDPLLVQQDRCPPILSQCSLSHNRLCDSPGSSQRTQTRKDLFCPKFTMTGSVPELVVALHNHVEQQNLLHAAAAQLSDSMIELGTSTCRTPTQLSVSD